MKEGGKKNNGTGSFTWHGELEGRGEEEVQRR